ncbi:MAG: hypothetical protein P1P88_09215 [Bacteroidales bacterium]|nr:hypothetical protein [Bacteroidales bacterium]
MNIKNGLFLCVIIFFGLFQSERLNGQVTPDLFADKPDNKVKEVISYLEGKDTSTIESVISFDRNANVIREAQPDFYVEINYKYDKAGKLIEKDALYGESFANGKTIFQYIDNKVVESTFALGFYSQVHKTFDNRKKLQKLKSLYIAAGMGESKIETENYEYNNKKLLVRKEMNLTYYDLNKETGTIDEVPANSLIVELRAANVLKNEKYFTTYSYDKKNKLVAEVFYNADTKKKLWEINYKYNSKGLLVNEMKSCSNHPENNQNNVCKEYQVIKDYDADGKLMSITTKEKNFEQKLVYKDGRLINTTEKYEPGDAIHYTYKYKYYSD